MNKVTVYLLTAFAIFSAASGQVVLKFATEDMRSFHILSFFKPKLLAGLFLYGLSFVLWVTALKYMELSKAYPLFSISTFILVIIGSSLFLHESVSWINLIGILLGITGIILMQL